MARNMSKRQRLARYRNEILNSPLLAFAPEDAEQWVTNQLENITSVTDLREATRTVLIQLARAITVSLVDRVEGDE